MKDFIAIFLACFIACTLVIIFFGQQILNNIWFIIALVSIILTIFIKVSINHETRIEELEKKIELLSNREED